MESAPLQEATTDPIAEKPFQFWFGRVSMILGLLTMPILIGSLIVGWNLASGADWYYCLLFALMAMAVTSAVL